jgi:hypothetical protein
VAVASLRDVESAAAAEEEEEEAVTLLSRSLALGSLPVFWRYPT